MSYYDDLSKGSTVFVTGGTGYIGAHVIDQFLKAPLDFKVRAAARSQDKADKLTDFFATKYETGRVETVIIPDLTVASAYNDAVKGVAAIAHLSAPVSFDRDWDDMVVPTVASVKNLLSSASKEASVKRFVFCSSSGASGVPNKVSRTDYEKGAVTVQKLDAQTWNDGSVERAKAAAGKGQKESGADMYYAMKTLSERALWDYVADEKPHFATIAILPNANFGPVLPYSSASTGAWVTDLTKGKADSLYVDPQWWIDVRDTALLHVLAATSSSIKDGERIWAVTSPFSWPKVIAEIQAIQPQLTLPTVSEEQDVVDATDIDNARYLEILKANDGPISLTTSISDALNSSA